MSNRLTLSRVVELRNIRSSTSASLRGVEIPECWQLATIASATNALDRSSVSARASRRRLVEKATRLCDLPTRPAEAGEIDSVETFSFKAPRVPEIKEGL